MMSTLLVMDVVTILYFIVLDSGIISFPCCTSFNNKHRWPLINGV